VRLRRLALLALPLSIILASCGGAIDSNEAVISGKLAPTNAGQLEDEMKTLTSLDSFTTGWKEGTQAAPVVGGKYSPEFVAYVLQNRFFNALIQEEAKARKLEPAPATDEMKANASGAFPGGEATFDALPNDYRANFLLTQQYIQALLADAAGDPKVYFDKNPNEFMSACVKHILVPTKAEADAAKKRIDGGEAFDKVAKEVSQDPGSKDAGGDLGCNALSGFVKPFSDAAVKAELNKLTDPVQSDFGFHLLIVSKREAGKWDEAAQAQATQAAQAAGVEGLRKALSDRVKQAGTKVNADFARLDTADAIPQIVAKESKTLATTTIIGGEVAPAEPPVTEPQG
jgi:hypothetical protein